MKTRYYAACRMTACLIACWLTLTGPAFLHAQTTPAPRAAAANEGRIALKEFVVSETQDATGYAATSISSATRTNTALIDTPNIVNVVTRAFIEDTQASELYHALKYVPGVSLESNSGDSIMMRGYTVRAQFTDGIFDNQRESQLGSEPYQFERVEVLKGPAALVYGSTALGGLVNRVRKTPKFKKAGQFALTYGNYGQHKVEVDYTAPINDKLAYRLVGVYRDDGNTVNGVNVDFAYTRRWNLTPTLLWRPSDTTQVKVLGEFMSERYYKHWGENMMFTQTYDPNSSAAGALLSYPFGTETTFGVPFLQGGITTLGLLPRTFTFGEADAFVHNDKQAGTLSLETQVNPDWSVRILANGHWWDHMALDYIPGFPQRNNRFVLRSYRPIANDDFTASFSIDSVYNFSLIGGQHKLLSIMQTDYQSNWYPIWGPAPGTPSPDPIDMFNPVHTGYTPTALVKTQNQYSNNYQFGFAAQDHAKFMDEKIQLVAGVRYDWFASQTENLLLTTNRNGNRNADQEWSYKYGVVYKPIKAFSVFYNHSETYNPNFGVQPDGTTFPNQQGNMDEIGVKSAFFDGRLGGSLAVYESNLTNILGIDPDPVRVLQGWRTVNSFQEVNGVEIELFLNVTRNWQVNLGGGILDMKIPVGTGQAALHGDKRLPRNLPQNTYSGWTRYDFSNGPLKGFAVGGGMQYTGKRAVDAENLFFFPSVTTADAFIQYRWDKYRFALNVSNIADEQYIMRSVAARQMFAGPRRQIKFRVSRDF